MLVYCGILQYKTSVPIFPNTSVFNSVNATLIPLQCIAHRFTELQLLPVCVVLENKVAEYPLPSWLPNPCVLDGLWQCFCSIVIFVQVFWMFALYQFDFLFMAASLTKIHILWTLFVIQSRVPLIVFPSIEFGSTKKIRMTSGEAQLSQTEFWPWLNQTDLIVLVAFAPRYCCSVPYWWRL